MNSAGSGSVYIDNVFFRQIPSPKATNWTALVPFGSVWRYYTNTPATNWPAVCFSDAAWPLALAKFGAGSGPTHGGPCLAQQGPGYQFRKNVFAACTKL